MSLTYIPPQRKATSENCVSFGEECTLQVIARVLKQRGHITHFLLIITLDNYILCNRSSGKKGYFGSSDSKDRDQNGFSPKTRKSARHIGNCYQRV